MRRTWNRRAAPPTRGDRSAGCPTAVHAERSGSAGHLRAGTRTTASAERAGVGHESAHGPTRLSWGIANAVGDGAVLIECNLCRPRMRASIERSRLRCVTAGVRESLIDLLIWLPSLSRASGRSSRLRVGSGGGCAGQWHCLGTATGPASRSGRWRRDRCRGRVGGGFGGWRRLAIESGLWLVRRVDRRDGVGRAGCQSRSRLPSRTRLPRVGHHLPIDHIGQSSFEAAHGFHRGLARGELAPEVRPALGVMT